MLRAVKVHEGIIDIQKEIFTLTGFIMKFDFLSESDQAYYIHKASTLVEASAIYSTTHSGKNIVIKYGGHAMGED